MGAAVALPLAMIARCLHAFVRALVPTVYRYRVRGKAAVPATGAALIVANHVSFVDSMVLGAALDRVPRFVMHAYWLGRLPWARWIFRGLGVIPITGRNEDPVRFAQAFEEIDAALANGELVVIFPEGRLTEDGEVGTFRRGVEHVLRRRPVPVVPMALRGLWGSVWSKGRGAGARRGLRRRQVEVVGGRVLSPAVDAGTMRSHVARLRASWA